MNCEVQEQHPQQQQAQQQHQQSSNKLLARKPPQQQQQQQQQHHQQQQQKEKESRKIADDDNERKNLEFAQKLGYSEQSIHTALTRLGSEKLGQNELLAELIKMTTAEAPGIRPAHNSHSNAVNGLSNSSPLSTSATSGSSGSNSNSLRHIVIDGSNVALSHGNNTLFSCRGIRICVDWFRQRGHRQITAFVPNWRKESPRSNMANSNITEQELLHELAREGVLVFTPSRHLDGKRVACYDDRYILKLAAEEDGIVVSNDNYRDLLLESQEYRKVVQERLLMYSFVNDRFMPPDDPLGRSGPTLDMFLRSQTLQKMADAQQLCPYGKKCTYGQKCRFRHQPATLLQRLPLQASHSAPLNGQQQQQQQLMTNGSALLGGNSNNNNSSSNVGKLAMPLGRTKSNTVEKISEQQQQQLQLCNAFNSQLELTATATTPATSAGGSGGGDMGEPLNRHKKLQRQQGPPVFRQLVPTFSAPAAPLMLPPLQANPTAAHQHNQFQHQLLYRTPSAPAPTEPNHSLPSPGLALPAHSFAHLSASDSRINEELHLGQSREEKRRLLRYHLSSLFPQNQVHAVLQMYPEETDAKAICAAILHLFPHN